MKILYESVSRYVYCRFLRIDISGLLLLYIIIILLASWVIKYTLEQSVLWYIAFCLSVLKHENLGWVRLYVR